MTADVADTGVAAEELRQFVERLERLQEERKALADDIRDVYGEAKGRGFDVPTLKQILKIREKEPHERAEQEAILELYLSALGMSGYAEAPSRAPAPAPAREAEVTISTKSGKSATMSVETAATVMTALQTEAGRAVLADAIETVRNAPEPAAMAESELGWPA